MFMIKLLILVQVANIAKKHLDDYCKEASFTMPFSWK